MQRAKIVTSPVARAVKRLGGLTKTANAMLVSGQAVNEWRHRGYVPTREHAIRLAELSGISAARLMGLPDRPHGGDDGGQGLPRRVQRNHGSAGPALARHADAPTTHIATSRAAKTAA